VLRPDPARQRSSSRPLAGGLRLALTTLTVLPVRGPSALDRRTAGTAMSLAPVVGLALGGTAAVVLLGAEALLPAAASPLLAAVLAVAALALLTRGLHLDGLVDTVDGLASYAPPERARAVMKSPEAGALGVAALLLVLAAQVAALLACLQAGRGAGALLLAVVTARLAVTAACTSATPAATSSGLGSVVAGTVPRWLPLPLALVTAGAAAAAALALGGDAPDALRPVAAVTLALLAAAALRRHAVRRLGGVTGDVLGALVEVTTAVVLVVMAVGD
jgi:adenosylcobinamide-GDP ribazoletransferase